MPGRRMTRKYCRWCNDATVAGGTSVARFRGVTFPHLQWPADASAVARNLALLDDVPIKAWRRLLVVECGDGWIVEEAWRRQRRGYACGVDLRVDLIARASSLRAVPGALEFKTWDGSRLPFEDAAFDIVLFTITGALCPSAELRRVLSPGGKLRYFG